MFGIHLCSTEHFGVSVEIDLSRLTAYDPLHTIFDVGGNFGQTALRFASAFPAATIYTFEPVPTSFDRLKDAVQRCKNIKSFNTALGSKSGTAVMNIMASSGSNSILQNEAAIGSVPVQIETIDAFATSNSIQTIDLLKIDVEGYELQVLKGAENLLTNGQIRYVFAECTTSIDTESPHTSFFDLHYFLEQHGFCFVSYYGESFRLRDGCALGNVLYALQSKLPERAAGRTLNIA